MASPVSPIRSLRSRVLLTLLPIFAVFLASSLYWLGERREDDIAHATSRLQSHASSLVALQSEELRRVGLLMDMLVETGSLARMASAPGCDAVIREQSLRDKRLAGIRLFDANGKILCSSNPAPSALAAAEREQAMRALTHPELQIGEAVTASRHGRISLTRRCKLGAAADAASGALLVTLDLDWINREFGKLDYPAGTTFGLIDEAGVVLASYPEPESIIGANVSQYPGYKAMQTLGGEGTVEVLSHDGLKRIFVFAPYLRTAGKPITLWIGLPKESVTAAADRQFAQALLILLLAGFAAFGLAWFAGERYVVAPIAAIAEAARQLSSGDYRARTHLQYRQDELGELARTFDSMAQSLVSKSELLRVNRALMVLGRLNKSLVRARNEEELIQDTCRIIVEYGGYRMAWVGFLRHADGGIVPIERYGLGERDIAAKQLQFDHEIQADSPAATATRSGTHCLIQNIEESQPARRWRDCSVEHGYNACIALPLKDRRDVFGALTIYAAEPDAFNPREVALLGELAEEFAFGIVMQRSNVERQRAEAIATRLAKFDPLTELPNRIQLIAHLGQSIASASVGEEGFAVLTASIDRFVDIQDAIGIAGADAVLKQMAERLTRTAGATHFLARSGDAFTLVVPSAVEGAAVVAESLRDMVETPFEHLGIPVSVQVTMGAARFPEHGTDADSLLRRADIAVRHARRQGLHFGEYSGMTDAESPDHLILLSDLRKAIRDDELLLVYQPKLRLTPSGLSGVEALVRWNHGERGMVTPESFIPVAERSGLIKPLTYWVIRAALLQIAAWGKLGLSVRVAVNVSPNNLRDPEFYRQLTSMPAEIGVPLDLLDLEITETALMEDPINSRDVLQRITELGVRIYIDDFGTGYSSLAYLATLPIHALKIDRSFIIKMHEPKHRAIVESTISMAHSLGLRVVAEGVETEEQQWLLARHGCDEIQGYLHSRPLAPADFVLWRTASGHGDEGLVLA